jgi:hypothetical protein
MRQDCPKADHLVAFPSPQVRVRFSITPALARKGGVFVVHASPRTWLLMGVGSLHEVRPVSALLWSFIRGALNALSFPQTTDCTPMELEVTFLRV